MGKIKASVIMEIMGRPASNVKESLNTVVVKMGSEKGVKLLGKKYHEPKLIKEVKNLFSAFAEVDIEFDDLDNLFALIMGYMPSNVEIYEPENFKMSVTEINALSNYIVAKLHNYDNIAKKVIAERDILMNQLQYIKEGGNIDEIIKSMKQGVMVPKKKEKTNKSNTGKKTNAVSKKKTSKG